MTTSARWRQTAVPLLALVLAVPGVAGPVLAQEGELHRPGYYFIDGFQLGCGDVETVVTDEGPELIYPRDGYVIVLNGAAFDPLPTGLKMFAYYHTCGMMLFRTREDAASVADTMATRRGIAEGWMTAAVAEQICETDLLAEAGWTVAPDAERCAAIREGVRPAP